MPFIPIEFNELNAQKGVIIFKHSEIGVFLRQAKSTRSLIRNKYWIGLYFGSYTKVYSDFAEVDFYIAEDNVLDISDTTVPRVNVSGYNFISPPKPSNPKKLYDFIFIGNPSRNKNLTFLLKAIDRLDLKLDPQFLIINRADYRNCYQSFLNLFIKRRLKKKRLDYRGKVTYIEPDASYSLIPKKTVYQLLEMSKCLILISNYEGGARVFAEAKSLDLDVISYSEMKGATNNHIDPNYDIVIKDLNRLDVALREYLTRPKLLKKRVDYSGIFCEDCAKSKFAQFLAVNFNYDLEKLTERFSTIRFENSIQSHNRFLDRGIPSNVLTDECLTMVSMYKFCTSTTSMTSGAVSYTFYKFYDLYLLLLRNIKRMSKLLKRRVKA